MVREKRVSHKRMCLYYPSQLTVNQIIAYKKLACEEGSRLERNVTNLRDLISNIER